MVSVTLEGVTKRFDEVVAVNDVSLHIRKGELFFLLGPSGCGKTTLLRMIAGFYTPDGGRILFDDRDMTKVPPHKRNTGMVFQNYALWPHMTVAENVAYGLDVRSISSSDKKDRVNAVLETVRMEQYADRTPNQLSGGQQQRIALARALVIEPDAVLLDEPLSNLDARLRLEMRIEIRRIHEVTGVTMIYVTHDQKEALSMADRMAVMRDGIVMQEGAPREVYSRPANAFVANFIGETNLFTGVIARDRLTVETSHGLFRSSVEAADALTGEVTCSIRPECMSVASDGDDSTGGMLEGTVESVVYLGDTEQYIINLPDGTTVRCVEWNPSEPRAHAGEAVRLSFRAEDVVLLPPDNV
jgi:iron(III) transport system ATP-binding protein